MWRPLCSGVGRESGPTCAEQQLCAFLRRESCRHCDGFSPGLAGIVGLRYEFVHAPFLPPFQRRAPFHCDVPYV
jgi:hypothetical protein